MQIKYLWFFGPDNPNSNFTIFFFKFILFPPTVLLHDRVFLGTSTDQQIFLSGTALSFAVGTL